MEEASDLPRKEATNALLQRHVFFSKRPKYERTGRFANAPTQALKLRKRSSCSKIEKAE